MKTIKILLVVLLLVGCTKNQYKTEPIEKYKNKNIIVIGTSNPSICDAMVRVKTKDSVFYIRLTLYDRKNLKIGDTIK